MEGLEEESRHLVGQGLWLITGDVVRSVGYGEQLGLTASEVLVAFYNLIGTFRTKIVALTVSDTNGEV